MYLRIVLLSGISLFLASSLLLTEPVLGVPSVAAATKCNPSTGASWDQAQTGACRFTVLTDFGNFGGSAVRDNNTGLVWQQAPSQSGLVWNSARNSCAHATIGGQFGWRLPSVIELASLVDPTVASPGPTLPAGHPFTGVQSSSYWTATTDAGNAVLAWSVGFFEGDVGSGDKASNLLVWCVRGPMQESVY